MAEIPDPFAPVTGAAPAKPPKGQELWEPQLPAPEEPPFASAIRHSKFGAGVARWVYRNAAGEPLFAVVRFEHDGRKEVLPYSYGRRRWTTTAGREKDSTAWHFKRPAEPVPLYGLDRLSAKPGAPVIVCEGEKAADAADRLFPGHVTMAAQGGSKAPGKADWSPLAGRDVLIWPDADEPGWKFARLVAELVDEAGAASARIVPAHPSEWPAGWDLADPVPDDRSPDRLREMLDEAEAPTDGAANDDEPQAAAGPAMSEDEAIAEYERLSQLTSAEYGRQRKPAAQALRMGVGNLDKVIAGIRARRRKEAEAEQRATPIEAGEVRWPLGFFMGDDGLYHDTGGEAGPTWISGPFEVLGLGRDAESEGWGLLLRWRDEDGRIHDWPMPRRLTVAQPGELEGMLLDRGMRLTPDPASRSQIKVALGGVQTSARVRFTDIPGWCRPNGGDAVFTLIDGETIGETVETVILRHKPENAATKVAEAGTLAEWREHVAAKAVGNPFAMFAICMGFTGSLLEPLQESSGGFHLFGKSKMGKTLIARMGLSVLGSAKKHGLLRDWRSTANALEGAAQESNDSLLVLDEIHQAEPREVVGAVYQLANESGKGRLNRDSTQKQRRTWRTIVLSTGEIDIATTAAKGSPTPLPAGAEIRLPSIPVDGTNLWPNLHGFPSALALMASLQQAVTAYHGTAGRAFLVRLVEVLSRQDDHLEQLIDMLRADFYDELPDGSDGQVKEVARRCALIALAGELAAEWKIVPWTAQDATKAVMAVLACWINRRGGGASTEETAHLRLVRSFLAEFGQSRFIALKLAENSVTRWTEEHPDRPPAVRAGWRRVNPEDGDEFLVDRDAWNKLCAQNGADPAEVARSLIAAGHIEPGEGKNLARRVRLPGVGLSRVYVVKPSIFDADVVVQAEQAA